MTVPSGDLIRAAKVAARSMADRTTPFIFDEWYVAAFSAQIGRTPLKRKILGRNIVIFRTESGRVVALDDRCAHRSFPLSRGRLEGDTLVCGYHGFRYDTQGDCIQIPSQAHCPKGIGVRSYAVIERGPLIWIWMGNAESASQSRLADQPWMMTQQWECSQGYFALRASYVSLHENLMDLTHLSYLHARSFGTADYALAPYEVTTEGNRFLLTRRVVPTRLPPVWAQPTGILGDQAARIATSEFVSPGLHVVSASFYDSALPEAQRQVFRIKTAHLPTPETLTSTHYFIVHGRDFALRRPEVTQFMHEQLFSAFQEDVDGLQAIEQGLTEGSGEAYEISVASDSAAVQMRRYLKRRAESPVTSPSSA
jgi:phenylpropionate dioxygenase-like ring-hydroxylating dioxygenase large terminal subunit